MPVTVKIMGRAKRRGIVTVRIWLSLAVLLLAACSSTTGGPKPAASVAATPSLDRNPIQTFTWAGKERTYKVHIPAKFDENRDYPVVLLLHGAFGSAQQFERVTGFDDLADEKGFIAVYGQGTEWGQRDIAVWNAGMCCGDAAQPLQNIDDVGYSKEVIARLSKVYRVDKNRVYAAGMSNGGMMANRLACEASEVFKGIAAVAGTIQVSTCTPSAKDSVLIIHGTADNTVPYGGGASKTLTDVTTIPVMTEFADWGKRNGCTGAPVTKTDKQTDLVTYPSCAQPVELIRINGGRHVWPVGAAKKVTDFFRL